MANKTSQPKSICPWKKDFPECKTRGEFIVDHVDPALKKRFGTNDTDPLGTTATVTLTPEIIIVSIWGTTCVVSYEYLAEHGDFKKIYDAKYVSV